MPMSTFVSKFIVAFFVLASSQFFHEVSCEDSELTAAPAGAALEEAAPASQFYSLALDQVMNEALYEGALALLAFAAASTLLKAFQRKRGPSKPTQKSRKAGKMCEEPSFEKCNARAPAQTRPSKHTASSPAVQCKVDGIDSAATSATCQEITSQQHGCVSGASTTEGKDMQKPQKVPGTASATDFLVAAVRHGRAAALPHLFDQALARARVETTLSTEAYQNVAIQLLLSALRACAATHCFKEAVSAHDHMVEHIGDGCSPIWSLLLYSAAEVGDHERCKILFRRLCVEGEVSGHDMMNIVRCHAHQGNAAGLKEALASLHLATREIDVFAWNRSLAACATIPGGLQLAEILAGDSMCKEAMDAVSYNTLMKCNARAGRFARCMELHSEMIAKGLQPSEVTFGILLDACVASQAHDKARQIFDDLCKSGLPLNAVHCTTFIKSLASAGRLDEAASVLQQMLQTPGTKPDLITYSTLVKAYADSGNVEGAVKVLHQMLAQNVMPDEIVFNSVLNGCCVSSAKHQPSTEVLPLFDTLVKLGMKPTTTTLSISLKGLALTEAFTEAVRLLEDTPSRFGMEPEMRLFTQLTQACVKARKGGKAVESFRAMVKAAKRRGEKVEEHLARLLRQCTMCAQFDTASRLCSAANQAGVEVDPQVLKDLRDAASHRGKLVRVN